jgi:hypothetical protein
MRILAERLLCKGADSTYVDGELVSLKLKALPPPKVVNDSAAARRLGGACGFHVYCSKLNPGALALMQELSEKRGFTFQLESIEALWSPSRPARASAMVLSPRSRLLKRRRSLKMNILQVTEDAHHLAVCEHMLLYLTSQTWTRGEASDALAKEVLKAMDLGVHVMLAHESEPSQRPQRWCPRHLTCARDERCV